MDACCAIFNPYTNNYNEPIKPPFQPLLYYHGRIMSTFSALPQNGYVWEIIQRICRIIVAPWMYLTLVLCAVAGSCVLQLVLPKPSLIEEVFESNKDAFVNLGLCPLIKNNHMKNITLVVNVTHKDRGVVLYEVVNFNTQEAEELFGKVADKSLSYEEHQENYYKAKQLIVEEVMSIDIRDDIKDLYRKLPRDEFNKITYSFVAIGVDASGTYHESTFYDDRSVNCATQDKWKQTTFTDPATLLNYPWPFRKR